MIRLLGGGLLSRVVEWPLDGGDVVLVEVADEDMGLERVGRGAAVVAEARETLQDALRRTRPAVQAVLDQVRKAADPPDKVTLTFGIKLSVAAGAIIARSSGEANFEISVEWTRPSGVKG